MKKHPADCNCLLCDLTRMSPRGTSADDAFLAAKLLNGGPEYHALEIGKYPSKTKAAIDKLTPKERIAIALNAACEFSGWVKEPFIIKTAP